MQKRRSKDLIEKEEMIFFLSSKTTCLVTRILVVYKYSPCQFYEWKLCLLGGNVWLKIISYVNYLFDSDVYHHFFKS